MESVRTERHGRVLLVVIDRPERRNAIDASTSRAVAAAVDLLDSDEDLRAGVITGAGGFFSAGMDLKAFIEEGPPLIEGRGLCGITEQRPEKPLIAAVEGFALGGGAELALACDLLIVGASASFAFPEVQRGVIAGGGGGVVRLTQALPPRVALGLLLTGDPLNAEDAARHGLVHSVVDDGQACAAALALAERIAANAPLSVSGTRRIAHAAVGRPEEEMWAHQSEIVDAVTRSEDAREGASAFLEKRSPVWR